jgi:hypothetical protein
MIILSKPQIIAVSVATTSTACGGPMEQSLVVGLSLWIITHILGYGWEKRNVAWQFIKKHIRRSS